MFLYIFYFFNVKADAPLDDGKSPFVTARAVTTRTATTHEDLGTNARTQQMEEKTVAHSMTSSATRQEQRTVTQEVKTTSTVVSGEQVSLLSNIMFVLLCTLVHCFNYFCVLYCFPLKSKEHTSITFFNRYIYIHTRLPNNILYICICHSSL